VALLEMLGTFETLVRYLPFSHPESLISGTKTPTTSIRDLPARKTVKAKKNLSLSLKRKVKGR
jgi:hypothetical protein